MGGSGGGGTGTGTLFGGGRSGSGGRLEVEGFVDHGPCCCWFVGGMAVRVSTGVGLRVILGRCS